MDPLVKLRETKVSKVMKKRFKSVKPDTPVGKVAKMLSSSRHVLWKVSLKLSCLRLKYLANLSEYQPK